MSEQTAQNIEAEVLTVESVNPTQEELAQIISVISEEVGAAYSVTAQEFKFRKAKNSDGKEFNRTPLTLPVITPTVSYISSILEQGGKEVELLLDAVSSVINSQYRSLLSDDEAGELNASNFPLDKVTWEYIANIPKATRGAGIPKETWEAFIEDYCAVMPEATGKEPEKIARAAELLKNKMAAIKTQENVINFLVQQLSVYVEASDNAAQYSDCVDFLLKKAEQYLAKDEDILDNLL